MGLIQSWNVDKSWTLFLDRDGVINEKLDGDYVKKIDEFAFIEGALEAIKLAGHIFGRVVVVTNQQGIGKELMTHGDLKLVHDYMTMEVEDYGGRLDAIYYCPELAAKNAACRKPNTGMAESARQEFPEIDFLKSIMVGDSDTDIEMGQRCGMKTAFISGEGNHDKADITLSRLIDLFGDL